MGESTSLNSSEPQGDIIRGVPKKGGFSILLDRHFDLFKKIMDTADHIMHSDGELPGFERELIAAYVSRLGNCSFCETYHAAFAKELGLKDPDQILENPSDKYLVLFSLAERVVEQNVQRSDIENVLDAGYTEEAAEEIIHVASLFGFFNRLVISYGLETSPEEEKALVEALRERYNNDVKET